MALTAGAVRRLKIWGSTVGGSGGRIIGGFTDQNLMSVTRRKANPGSLLKELVERSQANPLPVLLLP